MITDCETNTCYVRCISWSAILAGALVGLGLGFLLKLLGVAIGLSAVATGDNGVTGLAIGGFIGLLICTIIAMFFAGWVAGRVGGGIGTTRCFGVLYGFTTWCVVLLLTVLLSSHMGRFMAYNYRALVKPTPAVSTMVTNTAGQRQQAAVNATSDSNNMAAVADTTTAVDAEKAAGILSLSFFLAFIMFAVGALSACIGGYCGIKPREECKTIKK